MAAAKLDINIEESVTWEMQLEFWENSDRTLPVDISSWTFSGAMNFSTACVPMTFSKLDNIVVARIEASALVDLPVKGFYTITANDTADTIRIQQGNVVVDRNSVCT